jgi:hypothetical protein
MTGSGTEGVLFAIKGDASRVIKLYTGVGDYKVVRENQDCGKQGPARPSRVVLTTNKYLFDVHPASRYATQPQPTPYRERSWLEKRLCRDHPVRQLADLKGGIGEVARDQDYVYCINDRSLHVYDLRSGDLVMVRAHS